MKNLIVALSVLTALSQTLPAEAAMTKKTKFRIYHTFVYIPGLVITTVLGGVPAVLAQVNQHYNDKLAREAALESGEVAPL